MKKFLLFSAVVLATMSASATNRVRTYKGGVVKQKKEVLATPGAFKNFATKSQAMTAFYSDAVQQKSKVAGVKKAASDEAVQVNLIPAYSEWTYHYSPVVKGFMPQTMYDRASFLVKDGKAYFQPFGELGGVVGVVESGKNMYSTDGADSITFAINKVGVYTDPETKVETDMYLEPCEVNEQTYTPYRAGKKTFGAYYFAEYNELYVPATIAVFEEDEAKTEVFDEYFVARRLDLIPQDTLNAYISTGKAAGKSYYSASYDFEVNAQIFLGNGCFYVKGSADADHDAWVGFYADETDPNTYYVEEEYLGTFNFYTDETYTTTYPGVVGTVGLIQGDGQLTGFAADYDYCSVYKVTDNADQTTTIQNTNNTVYGEYLYAEKEADAGMYNAYDLTVTIYYEPAFDPAGITTQKVQNGAFAGATFNLMGQKVANGQKGLVIRNGKKFFVK